MRTKLTLSFILGISLFALVFAQVGNIGGSGGTLGLSTTPLVTGHTWKQCPLNNQGLFINITIDHDSINKKVKWKGQALFGNKSSYCVGNLGVYSFTYDNSTTPQAELKKSVKRAYLKEYYFNRTHKGGFTIRGNFTK